MFEPALVIFSSMSEPQILTLHGTNQLRLNRRLLLHFSGCDYFRLACNQGVFKAAMQIQSRNGLNVSASRVTTGEREIYLRLEKALAKYFGSEAALLLPEGYLAPIAAAQVLAGDFSHVLLDELAHGALRDAAKMFDCPVIKFAHRDTGAVKKKSARLGRHARLLLLTDGMFSRDGSVAPLRDYLKILPRSAKILVDDAHGAGVLGKTGKGSLEHCRVPRDRIIQCITLSKAFGAYGGAVVCDEDFREEMVSRSPVFAGTTPLPPPLAGAALKAVEILSNDIARRRRLFDNVGHLRARLRAAGWEITETPGPIVRLPVMPEKASARLKRLLLAAGIYPSFISYYQDAPGGVFRFVVSSEHTRRQLDLLAGVLQKFSAN